MTEVLSKDHTILERPFMEFRPFGVDERGEKIRDVSGVLITVNIQHLEDFVAMWSGDTERKRILGALCRLLNERIRDSAYHVSPEFLRNTWHSYSYEFSMYLREFCEQLSRDSEFHRHAGEKAVPQVIQVLARSIPLREIYSMWPHFAQKYIRGTSEFQVVNVTGSSGALRFRFTEKGLRQIGPYRKACAQLVCQWCIGGISVVPESVHGMPRAQVNNRQCMVNGDEWCEWAFTWQPEDRDGRFRLIRQRMAQMLLRLGARVAP